MLKRGDTSAIQIMMAIVIVLVVGFFLIYGWNTGWKFWKSSTSANANPVGTQVLACNGFCKQGEAGKNSFCFTPHTVDFGHKVEYNGQMVQEVSLTCSQFADEFREFGFQPCENFC